MLGQHLVAQVPQKNVSEILDAKRIYLKINPFPILIGPIPNTSEFRIGFEVVGSERLSYQFSGSLLTKWILLSQFSPDSLNPIIANYEFPGYRIQAQVRYFFYKTNSGNSLHDALLPSGSYVALHTSYAVATWRQRNMNLPNQEWSNFAINALVGMQLMADDAVGIDMFVGLGYKDHRAYSTSYRGETTRLNFREAIGGELGNYLASPFKFSLGFHFTFGLI